MSRIISAEELERMYLKERLSSVQIAERLGWPKATVLYKLKQFGIPLRSNSEASKLRKMTPESNRKRSETHKKLGTRPPVRTGVPLSEDHKAKLRATLREKANPARTPESFARQGAKIRGRTPHNRGKEWTPEERAKHMAIRQSPEYRTKISAAHSGEKHYNWKGGHEARSPRGWEWKIRRRECYERDNWICRDCGVKCHNGVRIQAHHVIPRRLGGGDELENLVTLCASCHRKREARYGDALIA